MQKEKLLIIGSGPAGYAAGLYAGRAALEPLMLTGMEMGGQVSLTYEVDNYLGFPDGTTGPELIEQMKQHVEKFGARLVIEEATEVDFKEGGPFRVKTYGEEYMAEAVIVATGASPRRLGVPGEEQFIGRGVSFCATCDGFFFRDKDVLVIGGGDSAIEEAVFLTRFAKRVRVVHRRDELRAGVALTQEAFDNEKIEFIWDTVLEEIRGDQKVSSVLAKNVKSGEEEIMETDGVFVFIGHYPNTSLFSGKLEMDEKGYLKTDKYMMSSVPGVFAAGEVQDSLYRQIATSVGQGSAAGMMAVKWLHDPWS
ncbi:MAG: thioredoxin-disulfide reductase [Spirochaetia bacterium]